MDKDGMSVQPFYTTPGSGTTNARSDSIDKDGMYPQHTCKKCGKQLNADGGHPAELYAGTYNGLCYSCTNAKKFVADIDDLDGAQTINYPPHAPAWRRDREEYHAYKDCPDCLGKGQKWVSQSLSRGGGYRHYCERCSMRYAFHPVRVAEYERSQIQYRAQEYERGKRRAQEDKPTLIDIKAVRKTYQKWEKSDGTYNMASTGEKLDSVSVAYLRGYLDGL